MTPKSLTKAVKTMSTKKSTNMVSKNILTIILATSCLLMIPLVGMQLSPEVNWTPSDFLIAGALIFTTGLLLDFAFRKADQYRAAAIITIIFLFLWIWAELAVGIFTNWGS